MKLLVLISLLFYFFSSFRRGDQSTVFLPREDIRANFFIQTNKVFISVRLFVS